MSIFSKVAVRKPRTNVFKLNHGRKLSLKFGELIPIMVMDCVPGDKVQIQSSQMLRFAPLIAPIMHEVSVYTHFFFVPNRILWDNWEKFITGGEDGLDNSVYPYLVWNGGNANGNLGDYLGLPTEFGAGNNMDVSALPFSAFQKCYNDYYRDQNLNDEVDYKVIDGNNTTNLSDLVTKRVRAWQHDYFTSALPWPQKGSEATLPLGTSAPLTGAWYNVTPSTGAVDDPWIVQQSDGGGVMSNGDIETDANGHLTGNPGSGKEDVYIEVGIDPDDTNWTADLSTATAATINELRRAFRLQEWLEKNARGGSRYFESNRVHFGVKSPDARLQRAEFLGGSATPVVISEVLQTSGTDSEPTPQGNMAGHGVSVGGSKPISYFCQEHGYILGIMSVMPKSAYQQGIPRHFLRTDKFDYYWPSFANLGEQAIYNKELWIEGDSTDEDTFGYTPRYSEYKFMNDTVHGEFRDSLDFWHMGRIFSSQPTLSAAFIKMDDTEVSRCFAVTDTEKLYCHVYNRIKARRPMPYFGTPTL